MKKTLQFMTSRLGIFIVADVFIVLILISFFCIGSRLSISNSIDPFTPILDTLSVLQNGNLADNSMLISVLQERESTSGNEIASGRAIEMQVRLFYLAILVGVISFLFKDDTKYKMVPKWMFLILIPCMYLFDVHLEDSLDRQIVSSHVTSNTIHLLANSRNTSTAIYGFSYKRLRDAQDDAAKSPDRWYRKFRRALHPDLIQIIFYFVPLFLVYIGLTYPYRRKKTAT